MKLRNYDWEVFYTYHTLDPNTFCSTGTYTGMVQIDAETEAKARKIALPIVESLNGKIYALSKHYWR